MTMWTARKMTAGAAEEAVQVEQPRRARAAAEHAGAERQPPQHAGGQERPRDDPRRASRVPEQRAVRHARHRRPRRCERPAPILGVRWERTLRARSERAHRVLAGGRASMRRMDPRTDAVAPPPGPALTDRCGRRKRGRDRCDHGPPRPRRYRVAPRLGERGRHLRRHGAPAGSDARDNARRRTTGTTTTTTQATTTTTQATTAQAATPAAPSTSANTSSGGS